MRVTRAIQFGAIAIIAAGCYADPNKATVVNNGTGAFAYTRYVNAVNDTGPLDIHFVDELQNSPLVLALPYRGFTSYQTTDLTYQGKARVARAFFDSINVAQGVTTRTVQVGPDFSMSFTAGNYYTIVLLGPAKSGAKWVVLQDNTGNDTAWASVVADTTNIAARVVNLTAADGTGETVNSIMIAKDTTPAGQAGAAAFPAGSAAAALAAVAPVPVAGGALPYSKIALGATPGKAGSTPFDTVAAARVAWATGAFPFNAATKWSTATAYYLALPFGSPAVKIDDLTAIGGILQGGSAMSIFVFAPVTAGSTAPCAGTIAAGLAPGCSVSQTNSFRNYSVIFVMDHNPSPVGWF